MIGFREWRNWKEWWFHYAPRKAHPLKGQSLGMPSENRMRNRPEKYAIGWERMVSRLKERFKS